MILKEMTSKCDLKVVNANLVKAITILLILNSSSQEKDKENKKIESWSHMNHILTTLENKRIEFQPLDHLSLQDP